MFLPQTALYLNVLRGLRLDLRILAWKQLHGNKYRFDALSLAPLSMKTPSSADRGRHMELTVSILGQHLNTFVVIAAGWLRQRERVVDTVAWHPKTIVMPGASKKELLITYAGYPYKHIATATIGDSIGHGLGSRTYKAISHAAVSPSLSNSTDITADLWCNKPSSPRQFSAATACETESDISRILHGTEGGGLFQTAR